MDTKLERLLSKSLTTLEVMTYYLAVHTAPERQTAIRVLAIKVLEISLPYQTAER